MDNSKSDTVSLELNTLYITLQNKRFVHPGLKSLKNKCWQVGYNKKGQESHKKRTTGYSKGFLPLIFPTWLEKLGFLVNEEVLCSSKQVQENVVHLIILYSLTCEVQSKVFSSPCTKSNRLWKEKR